MKSYRIKDWDAHFENNRTRDMKEMRWVPVPNKHDGEGYAYIMSLKDGMAVYGAWHIILAVASKCGTRGTLLRDDGTPLQAKSIAIKSRGDEKIIQKALDICASSEVGWIEALTDEAQEGAEIPQEPARKGREEKEENGREESDGKESPSGMNKQQVMDAWNLLAEACDVPSVLSMNNDRWKHYQARIKEFGEAKYWAILRKEIPMLDDFAMGKNDRGWKLGFEYVIAPKFAKLAEGNFRRKEAYRKLDQTDLLG